MTCSVVAVWNELYLVMQCRLCRLYRWYKAGTGHVAESECRDCTRHQNRPLSLQHIRHKSMLGAAMDRSSGNLCK